MKKYIFIVNPISGTVSKDKIVKLIEKETPSGVDVQIIYTEYPGHATEIAKVYNQVGNTIIAVGGDGTVNETAAGLIKSVSSLGIIPLGSGNGLARHLHIPMKGKEALQHIFRGQARLMDCGYLNDHTPFFCTAGFGFDAEVAHDFAKQSVRGLLTYLKVSYTTFKAHKAKQYRIVVDGKLYEGNFFNVTVANASQFGNNAYIAPRAHVSDGQLDVVMIKKFPSFKGLVLAWRLFRKGIHKSPYVETIKGREIQISCESEFHAHIDGDPVKGLFTQVSCSVVPGGIQVLI